MAPSPMEPPRTVKSSAVDTAHQGSDLGEGARVEQPLETLARVEPAARDHEALEALRPAHRAGSHAA
jgi:hypothetical protein